LEHLAGRLPAHKVFHHLPNNVHTLATQGSLEEGYAGAP
jgi:hypothetical protein